MQEQQQTNRARMIGYAIGLVVMAGVVAWKFMLVKLS
jgi:hypothetical protein